MRKIPCLVVILLFCLSSILPVVNSIYVEKSTDILENSFDNGPMDSAWPMFQHDNKHTGRSPYGVLGNAGAVKWKFNMSGLTTSSPTIDKNGTIYIGSNPISGDSLFAIKSDGSLKWSFNTHGWVYSSPTIASDGTIYVGSIDQYLYAFSSNGDEKWRFDVGGIGEGIYSYPAIADDGTIYFGSTNGKIYALNPNGSEKWHYTTEDSVFSSAAIDNKGYVYIGSHDGYLYALKPNGTLLWKYKTKNSIVSPPTIGDDGTIYFGSWDNYLYALYPSGILRWKFDTGDYIQCSPAIDLEGNIYVGSYNGWFYSISPDGVENWSFKTGDYIRSSPVIDKFGVIYICSTDGILYVLNSDGSIRWIFTTGDNNIIRSTPAIGKDGTIYICSGFISGYDYSYLYAINTVVIHKPSNPTITGPSYGFKGVEYTFTASCFHVDEYNVSYFFDWGDGTDSGWTDFIPPGVPVNVSHTWVFEGDSKNYVIRVKAKDIYGVEGDWSTFSISMPKTYIHNPIVELFMKIVKCFPFFEKILNQII